MPTGYTASACEREVPFEEFVWSCARAMGAFIMMRDDPHDAPIPERFEPSDYHVKELENAKQRLAKFEKMSLKEAAAEAKKEHEENIKRLEEQKTKVVEVNARLTKLRSQVADWKSPSPDHDNFKKFMLEQLDTTIQHDGTVSSYYEDRAKKPISAKKWLQDQVDEAKHSIEYHTKEHKAEVERTESRNRWIADLRASVPYVAPPKRKTSG